MIEHQSHLWGIDLGGTKIECAVLTSEADPAVLHRLRVPTEADQGYEHVLQQVAKAIDLMEDHLGYRPKKLGIGTPGTIVPATGLMKNSNALCLNGKPMQSDLSKLLGMQVGMANDANCFALAETRLGIVRAKYPDARVVFGVILGTGVGGGLVVNGQILGGYHGIGGEWGHNYLHGFEGRECYCGKQGCNESVLSGPSLEWYYERESGKYKGLKEIVDLARSGEDEVAKATMRRLTDGVAMALSVLGNIIDPDVIVLGGGVSTVEEIYSDGVPKIADHIFDHEFETPVVKPLLGDSAGVFGAAFLVV
ncbi:ROK family protein [Marinoscillum sp.]|uniref:ROK family protein n=1 Tax=Marinoscillum sp. TaxID=2024838 RepID=UPI003BAAC1BE